MDSTTLKATAISSIAKPKQYKHQAVWYADIPLFCMIDGLTIQRYMLAHQQTNVANCTVRG
jgi:hypothetical protein